mgnify:CR=1 FL=1
MLRRKARRVKLCYYSLVDLLEEYDPCSLTFVRLEQRDGFHGTSCSLAPNKRDSHLCNSPDAFRLL